MHAHDLVRMANQIATFFQSYPEPEAVAQTAAHIRSFWAPRMRQSLCAYAENTPDGDLHPLVRAAVASLHAPAAG